MDFWRRFDALDDSSDSDDDAPPRLRVFQDRMNPFEKFSDFTFRQNYRFHKETVIELARLLDDQLKRPTRRSGSISTEMQVLLTLEYLGSGTLQRLDGAVHGVHQSTVCRVVHRVMRAIAELRPRFVQFPEGAELRTISEGFYNKGHRWKFPGVVGAVDGTHVKIASPGGDHAEIYRNRKGFFSINVQLFCDDKKVVRDVVASWPGSAHDSRIFNESNLKTKLENLPPRYHVLGDSGYTLSRYLMTPFGNPTSREQERFNRLQSSLRMVIEMVNGILKRRFLALSTPINFRPDKCAVVIVAAVVLHNLAMMRGDIDGFDDGADENEDDENDNNQPNPLAQGVAKRNALVTQHFQ